MQGLKPKTRYKVTIEDLEEKTVVQYDFEKKESIGTFKRNGWHLFKPQAKFPFFYMPGYSTQLCVKFSSEQNEGPITVLDPEIISLLQNLNYDESAWESAEAAIKEARVLLEEAMLNGKAFWRKEES